MPTLGKQLVQEALQLGSEGTSSFLGTGTAKKDNQIKAGQLLLAQSELLASPAFDRAAINGFARLFFTDHQTQPGLIKGIAPRENQKIPIGNTPVRGVEHGLEFTGAQQPL